MRPHVNRVAAALLSKVLLSTVLLLGLSACDLTVSNPGPFQDEDLNQVSAHQAVVNGAGRALANAIASGTAPGIGFDGSSVAREVHPAGQTGSFGIATLLSQGTITPEETGDGVDKAQAARWIAEDGIRRIQASLPDTAFAKTAYVAQGLLYVGYINRYLGEHVCQTTIDGGPIQPFTFHFERAEAAFTQALTVARAARRTDYESRPRWRGGRPCGSGWGSGRRR
jgi:starch-binding outer membrane protein, SusD/RagB family